MKRFTIILIVMLVASMMAGCSINVNNDEDTEVKQDTAVLQDYIDGKTSAVFDANTVNELKAVAIDDNAKVTFNELKDAISNAPDLDCSDMNVQHVIKNESVLIKADNVGENVAYFVIQELGEELQIVYAGDCPQGEDADIINFICRGFGLDNSDFDEFIKVNNDDDDGQKEYESKLGFKVTYDKKAFTHSFKGGIEKFVCKTDEEQKSPIYIAIQLFADKDAQTLAEELALQSGKDDVTIADTYFGGGNIPTKGVYYTKEANDVEQIFSFHIVDTDDGAMLIEAVGYVGQPSIADFYLEQFFATFFVE